METRYSTDEKSTSHKSFYSENDLRREVKEYEHILSYYTQNNVLRSELFNSVAENIAYSFTANKKGIITRSQIRKLFDEVKLYDRELQLHPEKWQNERPYIYMLKSKIKYLIARNCPNQIKNQHDKNKKDAFDNLYHFLIDDGIEMADTLEKFHVFTTLFEAVYGFYYENAPKD